jgi:hypothetical protein
VIGLQALRTRLMIVRSSGGRLPDQTAVETTLIALMVAAAVMQFLGVAAFTYATKLVSTDHPARAGRYLERERQCRDEDR